MVWEGDIPLPPHLDDTCTGRYSVYSYALVILKCSMGHNNLLKKLFLYLPIGPIRGGVNQRHPTTFPSKYTHIGPAYLYQPCTRSIFTICEVTENVTAQCHCTICLSQDLESVADTKTLPQKAAINVLATSLAISIVHTGRKWLCWSVGLKELTHLGLIAGTNAINCLGFPSLLHHKSSGTKSLY